MVTLGIHAHVEDSLAAFACLAKGDGLFLKPSGILLEIRLLDEDVGHPQLLNLWEEFLQVLRLLLGFLCVH